MSRKLEPNDLVQTIIDPRHIGVIRRIDAGLIAEVRWEATSWVEYIHCDDLQIVQENGERKWH